MKKTVVYSFGMLCSLFFLPDGLRYKRGRANGRVRRRVAGRGVR